MKLNAPGAEGWGTSGWEQLGKDTGIILCKGAIGKVSLVDCAYYFKLHVVVYYDNIQVIILLIFSGCRAIRILSEFE